MCTFLGDAFFDLSTVSVFAVLFTLPIVVLFFLAQKTCIKGIATTGLKG
jgi:ABC-type maltose transport system permease subunit